MNIIPREGSNKFSVIGNSLYTNSNLESSNLNDELRDRGFTNVNKTYQMWDHGATISGPIKQDRVWFLAAPRTWGFSRQIAGAYWNKTQDVFADAARRRAQGRQVDALYGPRAQRGQRPVRMVTTRDWLAAPGRSRSATSSMYCSTISAPATATARRRRARRKRPATTSSSPIAWCRRPGAHRERTGCCSRRAAPSRSRSGTPTGIPA